MKKAVIAGATGLIGGELLNILLQSPDYQEVLVLTRRSLDIQHPKLLQLILDFNKLDEYKHSIQGYALFCCLGTTRNKTPNLSAYHQIDVEYPVQLGRIAKENGIRQYHLISAIGADINASNYYLKYKGEAEDQLAHLGLPCVHIYQPSFLTGNRKEHRFAERLLNPVMKLVDPLLIGGLKKYRSIPAHTVAMAMYKQSLKTDTGIYIHPSDHIKKLA